MTTPLPYLPASDDVVALLLLTCLVATSYVLSHSRSLLAELGKEFMLQRERTSIFSTSTGTDMRHLLMLFAQTCTLSGLCLFCYFVQAEPALTTDRTNLSSGATVHAIPPAALMGIYIGICTLFPVVRSLVYSWLGWIFFDKQKTEQWLTAHSTIIYYLGFPLFFLTLTVVYLPLSSTMIAISGLSAIAVAELLVFYKWFKLFCDNLRGSFLLILYFCALEAIPYLVLYRFLLQLNESFIINF